MLVHPQPDPVAFTILSWPVHWYGIMYVIAFALFIALGRVRIRQPHIAAQGWKNDDLDDMLFYGMLGVVLGGRLGEVLFYQPHLLLEPLRILKVWEGGMSFHGGFLGVLLAILIFSWRQRLPLGGVADAIALASPPAILLGRIANFINAELWGRPTTLPWGVIFPGEAAQDCPGLVGLCARHPSQLYEAALEGLLLGLLMVLLSFRWGALRRPWLLTGVFLTGYGMARFLVEFVRQPDAQFVSPGNPLGLAFHWNGWGLTMGQTLTLPILLAGLLLILWARRPRAAFA